MRLEGFVDVDGVRLHCTDDGPLGAALTLLLVHGWGSNHTTWAGHVPSLATRIRVITVDLRGHGESDTGRLGSATVERMAKDLETVIDVSGAGRVVVVGHSMGGTVATILAVERPDRIAGLVVVDPAYGADADEMLTVYDRLRSYRAGGGREAARTVDRAFSADAATSLVAAARHNLIGTPSDVLATAFESMYLGPASFGSAEAAVRYLDRRRVPVLAIYPSEARAVTERSTSSAHLTIAIANRPSHFLHEEEPAWFVDRLTEWLATAEQTPPRAKPAPPPPRDEGSPAR